MRTNAVVVLVVTGLMSGPAMAYIDPGSGSAIMSAIIGFFVAIAMAVKTYWYKIKSFFTGSSAADSAPDSVAQANAKAGTDAGHDESRENVG